VPEFFSKLTTVRKSVGTSPARRPAGVVSSKRQRHGAGADLDIELKVRAPDMKSSLRADAQIPRCCEVMVSRSRVRCAWQVPATRMR
jgi:hypothetical protein